MAAKKKTPAAKRRSHGRAPKAAKKGTGRPSIFETRRKRILEGLRRGMPKVLACHRARCSYDAFNDWFNQGAADDKANHDSAFRQFFHDVKAAEGQWVYDDLSQIEKAGREHWQARAWRLERRLPNLFGRKTIDVNVSKKDARRVLADVLGISEDEIELPETETPSDS